MGARVQEIHQLPSWKQGETLLALNMTQFETVVVVDSDVSLTRNLDHLAALGPQHTPAAACHPRRAFRVCSFNFGVHVLTPSAEAAARLFATYAERKQANNGGEQEVWSNFHGTIHELPLGYNAHHGLSMPADDWRLVSALHHMRGLSINRIPAGTCVGDCETPR